MSNQFSQYPTFFVWRRESQTVKTFVGTVTAPSPLLAVAEAANRWGSAKRYEAREFKSSRVLAVA